MHKRRQRQPYANRSLKYYLASRPESFGHQAVYALRYVLLTVSDGCCQKQMSQRLSEANDYCSQGQ